MPHLSKRVLEPEIEKHLHDSLIHLIADLKTPENSRKFLASILSSTEEMMIAKRIVAAFLIRHHIEQAKIEDMLKLTPGTIFRLKLWIQTHQEGFDIIFERLERQKRNEVAKEILYRFLEYAIPASFGRVPNPFRKKFKKGGLY